MNTPIVYKNDFNFEIGKAIILKEGSDVAIIAVGTMVAESLKAAKLLEEKGVSVSVIDMHTIKPLDIDVTDKVNQKVKLLVTVEEHSIIGGLGSAVAEKIVHKKKSVQQVMIGVNDFFPLAGDYRYMLQQCGLTANQIAEKIIMELKI
jgi:transketolase